MDFNDKKFTKLIEMEIVASSILIGFFFTIVISIVEKFRTEQLGGVHIPFDGWVPLQVGIVLYAYLTLFLFLSFIVINILALERLAYKKWKNSEKIHKWSRSVFILAGITGIVTLMLFSGLILPQTFVNPLLEVLSILHFLILLIIILFAIAEILKYVKTHEKIRVLLGSREKTLKTDGKLVLYIEKTLHSKAMRSN